MDRDALGLHRGWRRGRRGHLRPPLYGRSSSKDAGAHPVRVPGIFFVVFSGGFRENRGFVWSFNCYELVWGHLTHRQPASALSGCRLDCPPFGGRFIVWSLFYICPGHRGWFLMRKQKQEMLKVSCDVMSRPNIWPPSGPVRWYQPSTDFVWVDFWTGW